MHSPWHSPSCIFLLPAPRHAATTFRRTVRSSLQSIISNNLTLLASLFGPAWFYCWSWFRSVGGRAAGAGLGGLRSTGVWAQSRERRLRGWGQRVLAPARPPVERQHLLELDQRGGDGALPGSSGAERFSALLNAGLHLRAASKLDVVTLSTRQFLCCTTPCSAAWNTFARRSARSAQQQVHLQPDADCFIAFFIICCFTAHFLCVSIFSHR